MHSVTQHLIIGSTGKTGSRVMAGLNALGFKPKGASRHGEVHFDWEDPTTWSAALNGIDAVYLTYYPDLAIPKAPEDISRFCALAKMKGVKHITLLSGRSEPAAQLCENIIIQSGIRWTVVRASWFAQNFSEGLFRQFIVDGNIALPVTDITEPFIDIDDIADVVVASLTDDRHSGQLYEVTGPELISFADIAARFGKHLNRKIGFESISIGEFQSRMARDAVPQDVIETVTYLFSEVLDGRSESITDGVENALGRPATSFDQYILKNKQYFTEAA
ncbi:NAD(P)H azoreductase [Halioglobus japonicus]|nr:NAD(P)H azoreductase [Halioglobus japonicus]